MSEFDNLKNDAEQYAKGHPQQVREGEQDAEHAVESKLGGRDKDQDSQHEQGGLPGENDQGQGDGGQDSDPGNQGQ